MIQIRPAIPSDHDQIWEILEPIIQRGDSLVYLSTSSKEEMLANWLGPNKRCYVAEEAGKALGTFWLRDNQTGRGSHIANAAYAVSGASGGLGVGRMMGLFSLEEAKRLGYLAMQFNLVVKTNEKAVKLWQSIGFQVIGEIPEAFEHAELGLVNAYIMHQKLR
jgi:ribosomal protein S18 acetylase RimI-like enzyme